MKNKIKIDLSGASSLIVLIVLSIILTIAKPVFGSYNNIINMLQQVTVTAVLALGVNVVIFTGGIDISVGSVVALTGIVMGKLIVQQGVNPVISVLIALVVGAACGAFNGLMIAKFKLQPMIATLSMMSMARGAALTLADGQTITGYSQGFRWIGTAEIGATRIPVQIFFMLLLYLLFYYVMRYRKFGRYIYSIGGNEEATRLSGINVNKFKIMAYTISGLCAGLASFILTSKLNSAQSTAGLDYEMDAIAACVIGGTSLLGGFGSVWGTLIGALIMIVIRTGLVLLNISPNLTKLVLGVVILLAVLADSLRSGIIKKK